MKSAKRQNWNFTKLSQYQQCEQRYGKSNLDENEEGIKNTDRRNQSAKEGKKMFFSDW